MSEFFADDFETGGFSGSWDSSSGTINGSAALEGSYGWQIDGGDFDVASVELTGGAVNGFLRLGFRLDMNSFTMSSSEAINDFVLISKNPSGDILYVNIVENGGNIDLVFKHEDDAATAYTITASSITGPDTWEAKIVRATNSSSNDGTFEVFKNGSSIGSQTGIDNYDNLGTIDNVILQVDNGGGGTGGALYFDDIALRDDNTAIYSGFSGYDLVRSSGGQMKNALAVMSDGDNLFLALEDNASGNQLVFQITRPPSPTVTLVYEPGGGSAANVVASEDPDRIVFFGNFGTNVGVVDHRVVAGTNTDITPTSIGSDVISQVAIDPADADHLVAINKTDEDALESEDNGSNWSTLNAALGIQVVGMALAFFGQYWPFGGYVGGNDGVDENASYTPNEFNNLRDDAPSALKSAGAITGIDISLDYD